MTRMRRSPSSFISSSSSRSSSRSSSPSAYFSSLSRSPSPSSLSSSPSSYFSSSSSPYYSSSSSLYSSFSSRSPSPPARPSSPELLEDLRASLSYTSAMVRNLQTFESDLASCMEEYSHQRRLYDQRLAPSQPAVKAQEESLQWTRSSLERLPLEAETKRKLLHEVGEAVRNALHQLSEDVMNVRARSPFMKSYALTHAESLLRKGRAALEKHNVLAVEFCRLFPSHPSFCPPLFF